MQENRSDLIVLDKRLRTVAGFVRKGSVTADVGTDHAYVITYLVQQGIIPWGIGTDIHEGPLRRAQETVETYGVADRVQLLLTDGLDGVDGTLVGDVAIAGMGGEMIASILSRAQWLKNHRKHLILQPMTNAHTLRAWLYENGFEIREEKGVIEGKHVYTVMSVYYTGKVKMVDKVFALIGKMGTVRQEDRAYLSRMAQKCRDIACGRRRSQDTEKEKGAVEYEHLYECIQQMLTGRRDGNLT